VGVDSLDLRAGADSMAVDAMQPGPLVQRWQVVMFDTLRQRCLILFTFYCDANLC